MWRWLALVPIVLAVAATCEGGGDTKALYIALGDSLSEGAGASDPRETAFVPLVHESLGEGYELLNLGHSGDTSQQLLDHGHLDDAVAEIVERNGADDADNDVGLVTLEIGGNDLLRLYFSLVVTGACADVETSITKPECTEPLRSALDAFEPNLVATLEGLQEADPSLRILLLTLYNPFPADAPTGPVGDLSLEGMADTPFPDGINDIIREEAERADAVLVDLYPLFAGRTPELIAGDGIHPNDAGYRVMAGAVNQALDAAP